MKVCRLLEFETDLGWFSLAAQPDHLCRISFGHSSRLAARRGIGRDVEYQILGQGDSLDTGQRVTWQEQLVTDLCRYAEGNPIDFSYVPLRLSSLTAFSRRVLRRCRQIPFGRTFSYSELAAQAGSPKAARAVGNTMSRNQHPLVIPCHRVVGARRALGGFSAPQGTAMKRRLLRLEGVEL